MQHTRVLAGMCLLCAACAPHYVSAPLKDIPENQSQPASTTRHVVIVSIDGLRPDAIDYFGAAAIRRLMTEGSYTLAARTILPSKTLPSHTSMLTGLAPDNHGVVWNNVLTARTGAIASPTIFAVARARGYRTAAFFSKPKFQPLQLPGTLDFSQAPGGWWGGWSSDRTVRDAVRYLAAGRPNLLFVHLSDPDRAGHRNGWMSAEYGVAVRAADHAVDGLLAAAARVLGDGNCTVIVTADHGGHDYDHGSNDPRDVTIPWIAWGRGVRPGPLKHVGVRTMDTASTALWLLGLAQPPNWTGRPVVEAFDRPVASAPPASPDLIAAARPRIRSPQRPAAVVPVPPPGGAPGSAETSAARQRSARTAAGS